MLSLDAENSATYYNRRPTCLSGLLPQTTWDRFKSLKVAEIPSFYQYKRHAVFLQGNLNGNTEMDFVHTRLFDLT